MTVYWPLERGPDGVMRRAKLPPILKDGKPVTLHFHSIDAEGVKKLLESDEFKNVIELIWQRSQEEEMIRLRRGKPIDERGRWKIVPSAKGETACVSCPKCGNVFTIKGHAIDHLTSKVTPEVVCPMKCGFKERIVLKGWTQRHQEAT